jgi:hypothetical protein
VGLLATGFLVVTGQESWVRMSTLFQFGRTTDRRNETTKEITGFNQNGPRAVLTKTVHGKTYGWY